MFVDVETKQANVLACFLGGLCVRFTFLGWFMNDLLLKCHVTSAMKIKQWLMWSVSRSEKFSLQLWLFRSNRMRSAPPSWPTLRLWLYVPTVWEVGNTTPVHSIHSHIPVGGCALQPSRFPRWPEDCSANPASLILSQQCPIYRHCHYGCVFFSFIAVCCKVTEKKEDWEYLQMPRNILDLNYRGTFYCSVIKMAALYTRLFANARVCAFMCVYTQSTMCLYW